MDSENSLLGTLLIYYNLSPLTLSSGLLMFQTKAHVQTSTQYRQKLVLSPETINNAVIHEKIYLFCKKPVYLHVIKHSQVTWYQINSLGYLINIW